MGEEVRECFHAGDGMGEDPFCVRGQVEMDKDKQVTFYYIQVLAQLCLMAWQQRETGRWSASIAAARPAGLAGAKRHAQV